MEHIQIFFLEEKNPLLQQEAERSQEGIQSSPPTPLAEIEPAEDYTQVRKDLTKNLHPPKVKPKI
jgi:hypothetical protein